MRRWVAAVLAWGLSTGAFAQVLPGQQPVLREVGGGAVEVTADRVLVRARPFADGLVRRGSRTALHVTMANGAFDGQAQLAFDARTYDDSVGAYRRTVDLPVGSRKDVWLVIDPAGGGATRKATVAFGREVLEIEFPVTAVADGDVTIAVLGDETLGVTALADAWSGPVPGRHVREPTTDPRKVRVALVPYEAMPESMAPYETIDWVVWAAPDPSLVDPQALDALRAWVADGGHLLVAVTDTWRAVDESPLGDMLPVDLVGLDDREDTGLLVQALDGDPGEPVTTPIARSVVRDVPGRSTLVLASAQDDDGTTVPLWVASGYGLGTVHVLLADPTQAPLTRDVTREHMWRRLLWLAPPDAPDGWLWRDPSTPWETYSWGVGSYGWYFTDYAADGSPWRRLFADLDLAAPQASDFYVEGDSHYVLQSAWSGDDALTRWEGRVRQYLAEIPGVAPLPLSWLLVFSGLYLFAIGPLDWFVLRAIGKPVWTWVTFPVTIAVFSAVALVGTTQIKGNQAVLTRFEVIDVLPGTGLWRGDAYLGVWATRRSDLTLRPGSALGDVRPLNAPGSMFDPAIRTTEGGAALEWRAETWTLAYARTSWTAPNAGTVWVEHLPEGNWRVHNDLGVSLARAALVAEGNVWAIGPIGRGSFVDVGPTPASPNLSLEDLVALQASWPSSDDVLSLEWAESTVLEHPEQGRGHFDLYGHVGFIGSSQAPYAPLDLTGLNPVSRSVTVYRAVLEPRGER